MFRRSKDLESNADKITELYNKYSKLMKYEAYKILGDYALSEDAVHQAFIKIMNNMDKVNHGDEAKTRNFLVIVCRNIAIDILNKRTYLNEKSETIDFENTDDETTVVDSSEPSRVLIDKENVRKLANIIDKLPPIYKDVIMLEKLHHKTKEEIAEILGISYDAVRKRSLRARNMLIEALRKEEDLI